MTEKLKRKGFRWTFETAEWKLAACPICGETEVQRKDDYRDALPVTRSWGSRIFFKCGHIFNGRAEGRDSDQDSWVPLCYPGVKESEIKRIVVDLIDVRAADPIRISYDFDRDGWKIEQSSVFEWDGDDKECDRCWQEVAFVKAWQFEKQETADPSANATSD